MMWWLKARRAPTVLAGSLAGYAALCLLFRDRSVELPSFTVSVGVPLALFIPFPLVAGLLMCLDSRLPAPEMTGIRRVALMDVGFVVAVMSVACLLAFTCSRLFDSAVTAAAGRNAVFLTGLCLCARPLIGRAAVMLPVAWLFTVILGGFRTGRDPYPWTVVPEPLSAPHAAAASLLVFLIGLAVQFRTAHTPPRTLT